MICMLSQAASRQDRDYRHLTSFNSRNTSLCSTTALQHSASIFLIRSHPISIIVSIFTYEDNIRDSEFRSVSFTAGVYNRFSDSSCPDREISVESKHVDALLPATSPFTWHLTIMKQRYSGKGSATSNNHIKHCRLFSRFQKLRIRAKSFVRSSDHTSLPSVTAAGLLEHSRYRSNTISTDLNIIRSIIVQSVGQNSENSSQFTSITARTYGSIVSNTAICPCYAHFITHNLSSSSFLIF